jgi:hypothetical protein
MLREGPLQAHVPSWRDVEIEEVRRFCSAGLAEPMTMRRSRGVQLCEVLVGRLAALIVHFCRAGMINFDSVEMAQVFVIEPSQGLRQTLIIPKCAFEPEGAK